MRTVSLGLHFSVKASMHRKQQQLKILISKQHVYAFSPVIFQFNLSLVNFGPLMQNLRVSFFPSPTAMTYSIRDINRAYSTPGWGPQVLTEEMTPG